MPAQHTLLIVDDQSSICAALEFALSAAGYRIRVAESGPTAVALAAASPIDGALIDVQMPGMNGFDTCLRLQAQARERRQALRVWFITGGPTSAVETRSAELGALGVLRKPFDFHALVAALEAGLAAGGEGCVEPHPGKRRQAAALHDEP